MLEGILFLATIALTCVMLIIGIGRRGGYLQLPTLSAAVSAGWIIPQLWSVREQNLALGDSMTVLLLMTMLCLIATWLGWRVAIIGRRDPLEPLLPRLHDRATMRATIALTLFSTVAFAGIGFNPIQNQESSLWTGPVTIFFFFLNLKSVSFALSLMLFLRRRTKLTGLLLACNIVLYLPYMVLMFKRWHIAEFALIGAFALLMIRNWALPRLIIIAGFLLASVGVFAVGQLRDITRDGNLPSLARIKEIDFLALIPFSNPTASPEMINAANLVHAVSIRQGYTLGGQMWNWIVFQYVPGQFVGHEFKGSLMVTPWPEDIMQETTGYRTPTGTTQTGIATAYMEFWYFGWLFFFLIAYLVGLLWKRALTGNVWDKSWYAAGMLPAIHSFTSHSAYFFVAYLFFIVVLCGLGLCLNSGRRKRSLRTGLRVVGAHRPKCGTRIAPSSVQHYRLLAGQP